MIVCVFLFFDFLREWKSEKSQKEEKNCISLISIVWLCVVCAYMKSERKIQIRSLVPCRRRRRLLQQQQSRSACVCMCSKCVSVLAATEKVENIKKKQQQQIVEKCVGCALSSAVDVVPRSAAKISAGAAKKAVWKEEQTNP